MQLNSTSPFFLLLAMLTSVLSLFTMVFWIVVGWRAMRAHEQIAAALSERREPGP